MIGLIRLLVADHIKTRNILAELALLIVFMAVFNQTGRSEPFRPIALFVLALGPITVAGMARRNWSHRGRLIIAAGLGRVRFLIGLIGAAFAVDAAILAVPLAGALSAGVSNWAAVIAKALVLIVLLATVVSLSWLFSKLIVPHGGLVLIAAVISLAAFADRTLVESPFAKLAVEIARTILPPLKAAIATAGQPGTGLLVVLFSLLAHATFYILAAVVIFQRRELLFEEY